MQELKQIGDPELRRPAVPVRRVSRSVRAALAAMAEVMEAAGGVGLAGTQVGLDRRLAVVKTGEKLLELLNPEIVRAEGAADDWEGCLSVPGLAGRVTRHEKVTVRALDGRGRQIWVEGEGLLARALQHEIDHLDGTLFLDRAEVLAYPEDEPEEGEDPRPRRGGPPGPTPPVAAGRLRVVFMGTPAFALPALTALVEGPYNVVGVVVQPDRPAGRGRRLAACPVKEYAVSRGLPLLQPERAGDAGFHQALAAWSPDLVVTVAFGQLLPRAILELPSRGCVNLHASLLPRHRGAAPIQWALIRGDTATGLTTFYLDEGLDCGDVILRREIPVAPGATYGDLHDRLARLGAGLVEETVRLAARGVAPRLVQDDALATRARRLRPEDERLRWELPAVELERWVRALSPRPGAHAGCGGRRLKVWRARAAPGSGTPGRVVAVGPDGVEVAAGEGMLLLEEVQPEGGRRMGAAEYARGRRLRPGAQMDP